jgi:hypothetical protein
MKITDYKPRELSKYDVRMYERLTSYIAHLDYEGYLDLVGFIASYADDLSRVLYSSACNSEEELKAQDSLELPEFGEELRDLVFKARVKAGFVEHKPNN